MGRIASKTNADLSLALIGWSITNFVSLPKITNIIHSERRGLYHAHERVSQTQNLTQKHI